MWTAYVVTSQDRINDKSLEKFLQSILKEDNQVDIVLGLRDCFLPDSVKDKITSAVSLPFRVSLAKARNELLSAHPPSDENWVCFPDDDCWYPNNLLAEVESASKGNDFVLGVIDTGEKNYDLEQLSKQPTHITLQVALKQTASAALFISGRSLRDFRFDERLGLGAKVGSAEDLDLVLNLLHKQCRGVFTSSLRVGHPYKPQRKGEYFEGSIAVLSKYFGKLPRARYSAVRRLINGLLLVARGKVQMKQIARGLKYVLGVW
jgi:hypothetical protein